MRRPGRTQKTAMRKKALGSRLIGAPWNNLAKHACPARGKLGFRCKRRGALEIYVRSLRRDAQEPAFDWRNYLASMLREGGRPWRLKGVKRDR